MMMTITEVAERKRGTVGFLGCQGVARGCAEAGNKRVKAGCGGGAAAAAAAAAAGGEGFVSAKEKKDKIGVRVAELQRLVSPFGKTDTASVLEGATAYIKFLHEQLQVLSSPYIRNTPPGQLQGPENCQSLRSHGLCLVPVACTLQIARSNGADIWAPISENRAEVKSEVVPHH